MKESDQFFVRFVVKKHKKVALKTCYRQLLFACLFTAIFLLFFPCEWRIHSDARHFAESTM